MAENEPLQQKDMEFFGAIVTAQVKQSQWASNQVEENLQRDAKEWRDAFVRLWDSIDKANEKVDSMRIQDRLADTYQQRRFADIPFYWEGENK
jgi:hypothetical protein